MLLFPQPVIDDVDVEVQLTDVFRFCRNGFQLEDDETAQFQMVEKQVDEIVAGTNGDLVLPADECEAGAQFGQEPS